MVRAEHDADAADGPPRITAKELRVLCKEHGGYHTPEINEKLYLHYKGYARIENLDEYTGVRAIWLEGNGFSRLEGLDKLAELRCVYAHQNCIPRIEGLASCAKLTTLQVRARAGRARAAPSPARSAQLTPPAPTRLRRPTRSSRTTSSRASTTCTCSPPSRRCSSRTTASRPPTISAASSTRRSSPSSTWRTTSWTTWARSA